MHCRALRFPLVALPLLVLGCGEEFVPTTQGPGPEATPGTPIPADAQRPGDPAAGYAALVNEGYVSCGVPDSVYSSVFGAAPPELRLPGRNAKNADLPYSSTRFTAASGVELVTANCLTCHASVLRGEVVVGLGDSRGDFTTDVSSSAEAVGILIQDPAEKAEWRKWADRVEAIGPYTVTLTVGVNPADNLAAVLFAHRDRKTLAWSADPLIALPPKQVVPVDVPPWWRMAKKNAMFYSAGGRGDHARIMMTASTLCTDSVAEAQAIDAYFPDVAAYIASIKPPAYPFAVDQGLADKGRAVFEATCSRCHGTYGDGGAYPNLLIPLDEVGTDPALVKDATQFAGEYVKWFNESFYGEISRLEPEQGYVAPPLDGIWATAPFLHNGSVPDLASLLDSKTRPAFWTRAYDVQGAPDSNDYSPYQIGWNYTSLPGGQDAEPDAAKRRRIYDTTKPGYGNQGHTYGDALSEGDRAAVIEYLKTL